MNEKFKELYNYIKSKGATDLSESDFYNAYKDKSKFKDLYNFVVDDNMTDLNSSDFYNAYFNEISIKEPVTKEPVKKKVISESLSEDGSLDSQSSDDTPIESQESRYGAPIESKDETSFESPIDVQAKKKVVDSDNRLKIDEALKGLKEDKTPEIPDTPQRIFQQAPQSKYVETPKEALEQDIEDFGKRKTDPLSGTLISDNYSRGFDDILRNLPSLIKGKSEEFIVPEMNFNLNQYGFTFEETGTGDAMIVRSANDKQMEVNLESGSPVVSLRLMKFLQDNKEESEIINKIISPSKKRTYVESEDQIKKTISVFNDETKNFQNQVANFAKKSQELNRQYNDIISSITPELITLNPEKKEEYDRFYKEIESLKNEEKLIKERKKYFESKGAELDKIAGEYFSMKSEQGTWLGGIWNSVLSGTGKILAGGLDIGTDLVVDGLSTVVDVEDSDALKKKLKYGDAQYRNPFSEIAASVDTDKGSVENLRSFLKENLGDRSTTQQWDEMQKESFWGGAILGLAESLPGMLAPGGFAGKTAAMFLQTTDAVKEEMSKNPEFDNVSENEKSLVAVPIGIAVGALESLGITNALAQKGLLNGVVGRALGKSTSSTTAKTFEQFIKQDIDNMLSRGLLTIGAGGIAEFETGAAQYIAETGVKQIYNTVKDKKMFDTPNTMTDYIIELLESGAQEAIGGKIMSVPKAVSVAVKGREMSNLPDVDFQYFKEIANNEELKEIYVSKLKQEVASGKITQDEAKSSLETLNKNIGILPQIPNDLSNKNQRKALELISEKQDLEKEIDGKDKSLVKGKTERIAKINEELEALTDEDAVEVETVTSLKDEKVKDAVEEVETEVVEDAVEVDTDSIDETANLVGVLTEETSKDDIEIPKQVQEDVDDTELILEGKQEIEDLKEGIKSTEKPFKIFKGLGGKTDIEGSRINAHKNVEGIFSAVDEEIANEYKGEKDISEVIIPIGTTIEVVEIDTKGLTPSEYRKAEVEAINKSKAQIVKLRTIDGVMKRGAKKQDQYIIKDSEIIDSISDKTVEEKQVKELESKFSKPKEGKDVFESLLDNLIDVTKLDRSKLQSNPFAIPQAVLNESLKIIKKVYSTSKDSVKAIEAGYKFLTDKKYKLKKSDFEDYIKKSSRPSVDKVRQYAVENKMSDKAVISYLEKVGYSDAEIKMAMKKAPSANKILGKKRKKVTVDEMSALKDQIRLEAKSAREAVKSYKNIITSVKDKVKTLGKQGKMSAAKVTAITNKITSTNFFNESAVDKLMNYIEKVYSDAGLAEKINKASSLRVKAKKSLKSKVGPNKDLQYVLNELFSIDTSLIPTSMIDQYLELVTVFSKDIRGLKDLERASVVMNKATEIINSIDTSFNQDSESDSGNKLQEEIESDLDGYIKMIVNNKIDTGELPTKESIELAKFLNGMTADDVKLLINEDAEGNAKYENIKYLTDIKNAMSKGYVPSLAVDIRIKVNGRRSGKIVGDVVKKKVSAFSLSTGYSRLYGYIKSKLKSTSMFTEMLRGNFATQIDNMLGNYNNKSIQRNTVDLLASSLEKYQTDMTRTVESKMTEAESLLFKTKIPTIQRQRSDVKKSKYKIYTYMLQLEYESNEGSKSVNPAIDLIKKAIESIDNEDTYIYNKNDKAIFEQIIKEFSKDGDIDLKKLKDSFTKNELKALKLMQEVSSNLESKYMWISTALSKEGAKPLNNYVHHKTLSTTKSVDDSDILDKSNKFKNASTQAGTRKERTGSVELLVFDPLVAITSGARETLIHYHMNEAVRTIGETINQAQREEGLTKLQKSSIKAIDNLVKEILDNTFRTEITTSTLFDDFLRGVSEIGYEQYLSSVPRAFAELTSNVSYVIYKPKAITKGVKSFGDFSFSTDGLNFMDAIGSTVVSKMYDKDFITSKMTDTSMLDRSIRKSKKTLDPVSEKMLYLSQFLGVKQLRGVTKIVNGGLISASDKLVSKPFWFGSFAVKFKEITGQEITSQDMIDYFEGDSKFSADKFKDAINLARDHADSEVIAMANNKNPFHGIVKNQKTPGEDFKNTYKTINSFMASFSILDFSTAREAIFNLYNNGEMSKRQATALLAAVATRSSIYILSYEMFKTAFDKITYALLGYEEEEEREVFKGTPEYDAKRDTSDKALSSLVSTGVNIFIGRNLGNIAKVPLNYAVEKVNEKYLDFLRDGKKYDSYKDAISYNKISDKKLERDNFYELLFSTFSGPISPMITSAGNTFEKWQNMNKSKEKKIIKKWENEFENSLIFDLLGATGRVPAIKDIRRISKGVSKKEQERNK